MQCCRGYKELVIWGRCKPNLPPESEFLCSPQDKEGHIAEMLEICKATKRAANGEADTKVCNS
jgi:hypothetical protein